MIDWEKWEVEIVPVYEDYRLRLMNETDLPQVLAWRNQEEIRGNMYTDHEISWEEHEAWYRRIKDDESKIYHIFEFQHRPIGLVNFTDIHPRDQRCTWGFYLGETDVPRGSGSAMGYFALEYIFEKKGLRKLSGEVLYSNKRSIYYHKKFAFQEEGHFQKHVLKSGKYEDVIALALFNDQWMEMKSNLKQEIFN